ncbi:MAG TPA: acetoacetate--CoA ligase [Candidatus Dormibacteraeota bacterium]|nr:acetoacetate--CoA ligase [Candidatus Dormibacteraeota bacterium]
MLRAAADGPVAEGQLLWEAPPERKRASNLVRYQRWLEAERGLRLETYEQLWRWSVEDLEAFWTSVWDFFQVESRTPYRSVLEGQTMPGARWFVGAELNFAEHIFRHASEDRPALVHKREGRPVGEVSWAELGRQVASLAAQLRAMGVGRGDRVAAYLPNIPEAVIAFLACASLGAIWSCCSQDFGPRSVLDRFRQIDPKVLVTADGYRYGGRAFDRIPVVRELQRALPSLERTLVVPNLDSEADLRGLRATQPWDLSGGGALEFEAVPFDHPLWVLYSSGTTGIPKGIVHGHGGILLDLLVALGIHFDLKPEDRFFWFTTTGWVMWNIVVSSLLLGCTAVLYDGSPGHPEVDALWGLVPEAGITFFGTSAGYIGACAKANAEPGRRFDLRGLRSICYTGSPLAPALWAWSYRHVAEDVWFSAVSGGTDVCGPFVGGVPTLPVRAGRFQCRCLGASVEAFDEAGRSVVDEVGELVVTKPLPSMPLYLWNDPSGERYRESYFAVYPGVWRHGDWIKITPEGEAVIYGRSDATLNRMGVRIGSAEIYRVVEDLPEVVDSLVVDLTALGREGFMPLFVVLREGVSLDAALEERIRAALRRDLSPRHVPDAIFAVPEIPRTLNQKKLEVPVRKILLGTPPSQAVDRDAMSNPDSLHAFVELGERLRERRP